MEELRPNLQRARTAIALIYAVLILEIASLLSSCFQYDLLHKAALGRDVSMAAAEANDQREMWIGILYLLVYIVSAVTFIQWFRRAYFNLHQKVPHLSQSEGWAAGGWFVPIVCLYRPYQIMKELYIETGRLLQNEEARVGQKLSTRLLGFWWTLWIINNFLGQASFRLTLRAESIDAMITSTIVSMILNVIGIPLALITIKIIRDYSRVEPLLNYQGNDFENEDGVSNEIVFG